ncbi:MULTISPECIES: hypothetical protein [unclassified Vibrio]|uniref:hypothetical protein n=1 Tax=unclassified Vibrio TaxID=2614977 RepID=UPI000B8E458C|nr:MULTISPECIES: hypothetical protein [unclassified Vibrio]NAX00018.1 hypothetical protein [Vibrio sp. V23_P3S9T160]OXX40745.1 hypothetical protein B9J85_15165 [Vibrio sp. V11_P1A41T118]
MSAIHGCTEVPGTNYQDSVTVTYVFVDDEGNKKTGTLSVSGNKHSKEQQLMEYTGASSVTWAPK